MKRGELMKYRFFVIRTIAEGCMGVTHDESYFVLGREKRAGQVGEGPEREVA